VNIKALKQISNKAIASFLRDNGWEEKKSNLQNSRMRRWHLEGTYRTIMLPSKKTIDFELRWKFNLNTFEMIYGWDEDRVIEELGRYEKR
jgi:hypothetical protein